MEIQAIIDAQQERVAKLESVRESLVKLRQEKRTRERFAAAWEEVQQLYWDFLAGHSQLLRQNASKDIVYFRENKLSVMIGIYNATKELIGRVHRDLIPEGSPVDIEITGGRVTSSPRPGPSVELNEAQGESEDATKQPENLFSREWFPRVRDDLNIPFGDIPLPSRGFGLRSSETEGIPYWNRGHRPRPCPPVPDIPSFDGDLRHFESFRSIFQSVYEGSDIGRAERLMMLQSKLKGDARRVVEHLGVHGENYAKAWELLERRYSNPRALVEKEIQALIDLPQIVLQDPSTIGRALDTMRSVVQNLRKAGFNCDQGVPFIPFILTRKMDVSTRREFDSLLKQPKLPVTIDDIDLFLENRYIVMSPNWEGLGGLAKVQAEEHSVAKKAETLGGRKKPHREISLAAKAQGGKIKRFPCYICMEDHLVLKCPRLINSKDKGDLLRHYGICVFCASHKYKNGTECQRRKFLKCELCHGQHETVLHPGKDRSSGSYMQGSISHHAENSTKLAHSETILPTAVIKIKAKDGSVISVRCLVDQGSQSSYITEELVQRLRLTKKRTNVEVSGVGGVSAGRVSSIVGLTLSLEDGSNVETKALVVKRVTKGGLPRPPRGINSLFPGKRLADPVTDHASHVPVLLGSNVLPQLFLEGVEVVEGFLAQNTRFGWVVSGSAALPASKVTASYVSLEELEQNLRSFWDMPIDKNDRVELDEERCEHLFQSQHYRTEDGRYVVPTPWRQEDIQLGNSFNKAVQYFLGQEKRWLKNAELKTKSDEFMSEYRDLGHMEEVPTELRGDTSGDVYYIPYLSVIRKDATTSKLRNVFNASSPTSNGVSLNQAILPGPKLQTHIFDIVTRSRKFEFVFSSDITKMYRQILLKPEDQLRLRILWRSNPKEPIQEYFLKTVTYGIDCAPWQAIRTLHQVAEDNAPDEETKWVVKNAFYMDDLLYGATSIGAAKEIIKKISVTLEKGKMSLTKWTSNHSEVLENIDRSRQIDSFVELQKAESDLKILGLHYNPQKDCFQYSIKIRKITMFTKRNILSVSASLFDPIGWLLPVIMKLRIEIQKLWQEGYGWDEEISGVAQEQIEKVFASLGDLNQVQIPRWIGYGNESHVTELVGFSDASGDGYAAVIYSRVKTHRGYVVRLIASRGRVTPLKARVGQAEGLCTIPKLELESVVLLVELLRDVKKSLGAIPLKCLAYTDSEVALAWIRSQKEIENKAVKRRVASIRKVLAPSEIHYVQSKLNPADCASRGMLPRKFVNHKLWFEGPPFLQGDLPVTPFVIKNSIISCVSLDYGESKGFTDFSTRFSSSTRLINTVAWCLRWRNRKSGFLSAMELKQAEVAATKWQQMELFGKQIARLTHGLPVERHHWLSTLDPFLEEGSGLLRVGGRLSNAPLPFEQRHPIILGKCHLVDLLIRQVHEGNDHCGVGVTMTIIREIYYIPALQQRVKKWIRTCTKCIRMKGLTVTPRMADLPVERTAAEFVFENVGTDLCGPFQIKSGPLRNSKTIKVYVVVFVCMATKALHLEICSDLSTNAYLASFRRFVSRRGQPRSVRSDNGTNLVGAAKVLTNAWQQVSAEVGKTLAQKRIVWHHNPPRASHFGGLFEAAVGSFKRFVRRMPAVVNLSYEDFHTAVCTWEAILNSRPLYPLSDNSHDLQVLTPAHFLIQRGLLNPPMGKGLREDLPATRRWLQVQELQHQFWVKFEQDYLGHLQKRYKWKNPGRQLEQGDLVLIKEKDHSPLNWKAARVVETFPDPNGVVRQVRLKTTERDNVNRAVHQLVPLLPEDGKLQPDLSADSRPNPGDKAAIDGPASRTRGAVKVKGGFLARAALILCLFFLPGSLASSSVEPVLESKSIHLGDVQVKVFELKYMVATSVNLTTDLEVIADQMEKFKKICARQVKQDIQEHCGTLLIANEQQAKDVNQNLIAAYKPNRAKRAPSVVPFMVKEAVKLGVKYLPAVFGTGAMVYMGYRDVMIGNEIQSLQNQQAKIASLMLNITDLEYHQVEGQINAVVERQEVAMLQQEISEYSMELQSLIAGIWAKHQQLSKLRPIGELTEYVKRINKDVPGMTLPILEHPESIFDIHPPSAWVKDDLITIEFLIPLAYKERFAHVAVITTPDHQSLTWDLGTAVPFRGLFMGPGKNDKFFFEEDAVEILPGFFETKLVRSGPSCAREIAKGTKNLREWCSLRRWSNGTFVARLKPQLGAVFKGQVKEIPIICSETSYELRFPVSLIDLAHCTLDMAMFNITGTPHTVVLNWTAKFETVTPRFHQLDKLTVAANISVDRDISILRQELEATLGLESEFRQYIPHGLIGGGLSLIAIIIGGLIWVIKKRGRKPEEEPSFVSHLSLEDRRPGSWRESGEHTRGEGITTSIV